MIYHLFKALTPYCSPCNVVHYVSFRAISALLTAFFVSVLTGDWFIQHFSPWLKGAARQGAPEHHKLKEGMPTMGGLFIICVVLVAVFLWCNLANSSIYVASGALLSCGAIGFIDDLYKVRDKLGISAKVKFRMQLLCSFIIALSLFYSGVKTTISFPFFKHLMPEIGWLYIPWAMLVIVGCSNAVNLTDGLDGLAIGSLIPNFALYALIAYVAGNNFIANYLHIPFAHSAEIVVIAAALVGASMGFLWFNTYPAQIFMGDVGSLGLGAVLGTMALQTKQELLLPIAGGLFVVEALSVILQVISFKLTGKRIFKMAPIHHHFELLGWQESKITVRFGLISVVLTLLALITVKLR